MTESELRELLREARFRAIEYNHKDSTIAADLICRLVAAIEGLQDQQKPYGDLGNA